MKSFKTGRGKWILINTIAAIVLIGTVWMITSRNYFGQPTKDKTNIENASVSQSQKEKMRVYQPLIDNAIKKKLGFEPEEIEYKFSEVDDELNSVDLVFARKDELAHPYFESDVFGSKMSDHNEDTRPRYKMEIDGNLPDNITAEEMIERKVDFMINKIYTYLLDDGGIIYNSDDDVDEDVPYSKRTFYHVLSNKQEKILLKNYGNLAELDKDELTQELLRLGLIKEDKPSPDPEPSQTEQVENLKALAKANIFIVKNVGYEESDDFVFLQLGESSVFKIVNQDERFKSPKILEIKDNSRDLDVYGRKNSFKIFKLKKTGPSTYLGTLEFEFKHVRVEVTIPQKISQNKEIQ